MRKLLSIALAAVCVAFFSFNAVAQDEEAINKGIDLYKKAAEAYEGKQYDQAIQNGNDAYKIAVEAGEAGAELKTNLETLIPQLYYGKASNLAAENNYAEAVEAFTQAKAVAEKYNATEVKESINKAFPQLYAAIAKANFEANDFDGAIANTEKSIELDPSNSLIYLLQGAAYIKKNDLTKADVALSKCLELATAANEESNVKNAKAQLSMVNLFNAQAAMNAKKYAEMFTYSDKSLNYSESENGYKMKGMAAMQLKKWDAAIDVYSKLAASSTGKEKATAYYQLATAYEGKKNVAKACEALKNLKATGDDKMKAYAEGKIVALKCK